MVNIISRKKNLFAEFCATLRNKNISISFSIYYSQFCNIKRDYNIRNLDKNIKKKKKSDQKDQKFEKRFLKWINSNKYFYFLKENEILRINFSFK